MAEVVMTAGGWMSVFARARACVCRVCEQQLYARAGGLRKRPHTHLVSVLWSREQPGCSVCSRQAVPSVLGVQ